MSPDNIENIFKNNEEVNPDSIVGRYLTHKKKIEQNDELLNKFNKVTVEINTRQHKEHPFLPLNIQNGRLDMDEYVKQGIFSPEVVEGTKQTIKELTKKFLEAINPQDIDEKIQEEIKGEKVELLAQIVLYKFLNQKFLVVRSSLYDDIDNGVDNLIIDKETGAVVCTLDVSGSLSNRNVEEKMKKIFKINQKGGARIKYGLILTKDKQGKKFFKGGPNFNLPLFGTLIDFNEIEKELINFSDELTDITEIEKKLFIYFAKVVYNQVMEMDKLELGVPEDIRLKAFKFIKALESLYPNIFYLDNSYKEQEKGKLILDFYLLPNKIPASEIDKYREQPPSQSLRKK